jgi:hypothetical protein
MWRFFITDSDDPVRKARIKEIKRKSDHEEK